MHVVERPWASGAGTEVGGGSRGPSGDVVEGMLVGVMGDERLGQLTERGRGPPTGSEMRVGKDLVRVVGQAPQLMAVDTLPPWRASD